MTVVPLDTVTGQIMTNWQLRSPEQREAYRNRQAYLDREKGSHWVAAYHEAIRSITQNLTLTQGGAIIKLLPYLRFKSEGKLINNGKPLKQTDIQRIFKRSKRATSELLSELESIGVITIVKEGRSNVFYISAEFHTMGQRGSSDNFTKLYQVRLSEVVDGLELNDVGLLYKVLPYFHYSEYYLCANPNEQDVSTITHLDRESLAEAIGHEPETVSRLITKLQGRRAILSTKSGKSVRYLVHPDLMFRQQVETDWTRSVRKLFDQHD